MLQDPVHRVAEGNLTIAYNCICLLLVFFFHSSVCEFMQVVSDGLHSLQ